MALDSGSVEDITDDLLDAFEEALLSPSPADDTLLAAPVQKALPLLGQGLVHWPLEIRRGIAGYLPWRELVADVRLCKAWLSLGQDRPLWWMFFAATWPQHARRQFERDSRGSQDWPQLFRKRLHLGGKDGDVTEEDWLDFYAAQEIVRAREVAQAAKRPRVGPSSAELASRGLQRDLKECREEVLQTKGVRVPDEADGRHLCSRFCCFHKLPSRGDTFLCESSGQLHQCHMGEPCHMCVLSEDECYLVCPASGLTFQTMNLVDDEAVDEAHAWDPAMSDGQQYRSWLEIGYGMSEEQASTFFPE